MNQQEFQRRLEQVTNEEQLRRLWEDSLKEHWVGLSRRNVWLRIHDTATMRNWKVGRVFLVGGPHDGLDVSLLCGEHIHIVVVSAAKAQAAFYQRTEEAAEVGVTPDKQANFEYHSPVPGAVGMALVIG